MNDETLVSVLMAVHNTRVEYLSEAVTSILNQTYKNIEFIIIDDFSEKQETIAYLKGLVDNRIILIWNDENMGLTRSLNKGLSISHGKYVARMDSDDIALPDRIMKQFEYAEKNHCVFLGSGYDVIPKREFIPFFDYDYDKYKMRMIFDNVGPIHSSFFFNRSFFAENDLKYNERYSCAQDYALLCDLLTLGCRIGFCPQRLLSWRKNSEQISVTRSKEQWTNACNIRKNFIKRNYNISDENLAYFVDNLNWKLSTRKDIDTKKIQEILKDLIIENEDIRLIKEEIYRFWFIEAFSRIKRKRNLDIVCTKMFLECFAPRLFLYIAKDILVSRCGIMKR